MTENTRYELEQDIDDILSECMFPEQKKEMLAKIMKVIDNRVSPNQNGTCVGSRKNAGAEPAALTDKETKRVCCDCGWPLDRDEHIQCERCRYIQMGCLEYYSPCPDNR